MEVDLEQPTTRYRFRIYSSEIPSKLPHLDAALSNLGVPFHIKSLGRSSVIYGIIRTARFEVLVSDNHAEAVGDVVREIGGGRLTTA
jgi:hypothetical protein